MHLCIYCDFCADFVFGSQFKARPGSYFVSSLGKDKLIHAVGGLAKAKCTCIFCNKYINCGDNCAAVTTWNKDEGIEYFPWEKYCIESDT